MENPGGSCPICRKVFGPEDDVVICPHCGAPYHRECYQEQGRCSFEEKHAKGFEYTPPGGAKSTKAAGRAYGPGAQPDAVGIRCPACGTANEASHIFCERCGAPLHGPALRRTPGPFGAPGPGYAAQEVTGDIDGISARDWAAYIGQSAPTYLMRLGQMQNTGRKISFMVSALFFTPAYFAYRKMWGWAGVALAATLALLVPQILLVAADAGTPIFPIDLAVLNIVTQVGFYISWGVRLLFALFALNLYRKNAVRHIQGIRRQLASEPEVQTRLVKKGGVSVLGVVAVYALILAFYALAYVLMGDVFLTLFTF